MTGDNKFYILHKEKDRTWSDSWLLYSTHCQNLTYREAVEMLKELKEMPQNKKYEFVIDSDY